MLSKLKGVVAARSRRNEMYRLMRELKERKKLQQLMTKADVPVRGHQQPSRNWWTTRTKFGLRPGQERYINRSIYEILASARSCKEQAPSFSSLRPRKLSMKLSDGTMSLTSGNVRWHMVPIRAPVVNNRLSKRCSRGVEQQPNSRAISLAFNAQCPHRRVTWVYQTVASYHTLSVWHPGFEIGDDFEAPRNPVNRTYDSLCTSTTRRMVAANTHYPPSPHPPPPLAFGDIRLTITLHGQGGKGHNAPCSI